MSSVATEKADPYPSRLGGTQRPVKRKDPVVFSDARPPEGLSPEQVEQFREQGFVVLRDFIPSGDLMAFQKEMQRLLVSESNRSSEQVIREPDSGEVRSVFAVHQSSPIFSNLAADKRLVEIAQYLLGDTVYVHQSRINYKPGFKGREFFWHSDFETWHCEDGMPRMRALSASIALTDNRAFNGSLMVMPGSHHFFISCRGETPDEHYKRSLRRQEYGVPEKEDIEFLVDRCGIKSPEMTAGSVLLFDCNIMHGSNSNITPFPRSNVFIVYNSVKNAVQEPFAAPVPRPEFIASRNTIEPLETA